METPPGLPRPGFRDTLRTFIAWGRGLPRAYLVAAGILAAFGLAGVVFTGYTTYDYTMNSPAFCRSCHLMEAAWTRWSTSEHRNVDCHSCHKQSITESARQVIVFALRRPERVGRHAEVPSTRCAACHESGNPQWRQVAETAGHLVHAQQQQIECVVCHSQSIHRIRPSTAICATCHQAQATGSRVIKIPQMAEFHCVDCHQFLRLNSPLRPTRETCLGCHQALPPKTTVGWPANAPHTSLPCGQCHKPHEQAKPIIACATCHGATRPALHQVATHAATTCVTCHRPHGWKVTTRQTCLTCHTDKETHNAPTVCQACHAFR